MRQSEDQGDICGKKMNCAMKNFLFSAAMLLVASCTGSLNDSPGLPGEGYGTSLSHEMIVLGDHLEDPYSVENITKALESLYPTKADRVVVDATHLYVRFLPADEEQFEELEEAGLELLDHPVDYEIVREGDYYHDPEVPEGDITWQYAVVDQDFEFPEHIEYEILDNCYIPGTGTTKADWIDWEAVERESYRLTGNAGMLAPESKAGESGTPQGRITIEDDKAENSLSGVKGVKVSCNSFVKFAHGYTDSEGYYKVNKNFNSRPRYRLVFKNSKGFGIGFNLLLQPASASTLGKNSPKGVDLTVTSSSERKLFTRCVVNNAAYEYYESCRNDDDNIRTPPSNLRIWLFQNLDASSAVMLQQGALIDDSIISDFLGEYTFLIKIFLPDITIGLKGASDYAEVYSRTIHELAHASHFMQVGKSYWNQYIKFVITSFVTSGFVTYGTGTEQGAGYCEVGEMWAYYLQSKFYRERYNMPDIAFGTQFWFYPQILLYLDDRGLNRFRIFAALTSDINSREMLKKKLTSMYPEYKSDIIQAFGRYN